MSQVSCPELDLLASLAWSTPGVIGSRMTGGGFGGCTVSLVKNSAVDAFREKLAREYEKETGIVPEFYVADIGDGAREVGFLHHRFQGTGEKNMHAWLRS